MATYRTQIDSPRDREEVFEYMATFSNASEWDPGVSGAEALSPSPPELGSVYRLRVRVAGRDVPFDYRVVALDRPTRVVLRAENSGIVSTDTITIERAGQGRRSRTSPCSKVTACCAWPHRWSPDCSERWRTAGPTGCVGHWHEQSEAVASGRRGARGEHRG